MGRLRTSKTTTCRRLKNTTFCLKCRSSSQHAFRFVLPPKKRWHRYLYNSGKLKRRGCDMQMPPMFWWTSSEIAKAMQGTGSACFARTVIDFCNCWSRTTASWAWCRRGAQRKNTAIACFQTSRFPGGGWEGSKCPRQLGKENQQLGETEQQKPENKNQCLFYVYFMWLVLFYENENKTTKTMKTNKHVCVWCVVIIIIIIIIITKY